MHAEIQAFWCPKGGNSVSDYEDAFWARKPVEASPSPIRLAIGDGATEASFSALWAKLLVWEVGRGRLSPESLPEGLRLIQSLWKKNVERKPLPWYAEEKLRDGAFSTVLGLTIRNEPVEDAEPRRWEAWAVGDSCLFQVRGDEAIVRFPLDRSELFDSRPVLVPSAPSREAGLTEAVRTEQGAWEPGDFFYLMTDALACWFLKRWELGSDPLHFLKAVKTQADFARLVEEQRAEAMEDGSRLLKNDDVTLVRCCM